jgi:dynein heavy chain, axonemal
LESLEVLIDPVRFGTALPFLKIGLGEVISSEADVRLRNSLIKAYSPISIYLESFQSEFVGLYRCETESELDEFLAEPKNFEQYLERIEEIKVFVEKLKRLVQKEYFDMGTVIQMDAIASLRTIADMLIGKVSVKISNIHRHESENICREFEQMKRKALSIPRSTEQLMENGEYMLRVKKVYMEELRERIEETLRVSEMRKHGYI